MWRFAYPIPSLLVFAVLLTLYIRPLKMNLPQPSVIVPDTRIFMKLPISPRVRWRRLPEWLRWIALGAILMALAHPQSGQGHQNLQGQGVQIVFALDISGSMSATDYGAQNRLEIAKLVLDQFVGRREFDRIGLVVFARDAYQIVPPTLDYSALRKALFTLRLANEEKIPDGTAIGSGLIAAGNLLRSEMSASKVIILLTDGANNAGNVGPMTASSVLAALKIRVYTIGMLQSSVVTSESKAESIDENALKSIAATTSGKYYLASNQSELESIYQQIDTLERSNVEKIVVVDWQEQYQWFAGLGALLLLVEQILRQTYLRVFP